MTDIHEDFIKEAKRLLRNSGGIITAETLAKALQKQYRAGFTDGQGDGERYERNQQAYARY